MGLRGLPAPHAGLQPNFKPGLPERTARVHPDWASGAGEGQSFSPSPRLRLFPHTNPALEHPVPLSSHPGRPLPATPGARVGRRQSFRKARKVAGSQWAGAYLVRRERAAAPGRAEAPGAAACLPAGCPLRPVAAS